MPIHFDFRYFSVSLTVRLKIRQFFSRCMIVSTEKYLTAFLFNFKSFEKIEKICVCYCFVFSVILRLLKPNKTLVWRKVKNI